MAVKRWIITPKEQGQRLDVFLAREVEGVSRSAVLRALKAGAVTVAGRPALKAGLKLRAGDAVTFQPLPVQAAALEPEPLPLVIPYQDEDLAVIDKPAGLVVHPAAGHQQGTLVNALLYHLRDLSGVGGVRRPGLIHRLDKETSGLLLVAKHDQAHQALSAALAARRIERVYETVVWGRRGGGADRTGPARPEALRRGPQRRTISADADRGAAPLRGLHAPARQAGHGPHAPDPRPLPLPRRTGGGGPHLRPERRSPAAGQTASGAPRPPAPARREPPLRPAPHRRQAGVYLALAG